MFQKSTITIKSLNHFYGQSKLRKQVLFDINLNIHEGEIVIMTGPSGSGKTTLLSLVGCLRSIQEGSLKYLDQELFGANQEKKLQIRRQIGYIFQSHNLLNSLNAVQNVQMSIELNDQISKREARKRSEKMLHAVDLADRLNYYPINLSEGQKQRVAIARALANFPKMILADEPTASLDRQRGRDVVKLMENLARQKKCTILIVTHDNRILDMADRIIHMEDWSFC
ncbi:MAG: ATP-binding cassette domain-containing protein [Hydrococcus sp. SU_1_0]|nr:ATP-binding cassette domain-containing protein [Hydrococcus sp. SU_1_0]